MLPVGPVRSSVAAPTRPESDKSFVAFSRSPGFVAAARVEAIARCRVSAKRPTSRSASRAIIAPPTTLSTRGQDGWRCAAQACSRELALADVAVRVSLFMHGFSNQDRSWGAGRSLEPGPNERELWTADRSCARQQS